MISRMPEYKMERLTPWLKQAESAIIQKKKKKKKKKIKAISLIGKLNGKIPLGRPSSRQEDIMRMDFKEIGIDMGNWVD